MKHSQIVAKQLEGMRAYLDTVPEYVNTPIWITEIAVHVGYDGWVWDTKLEKFVKVGDYHWDKMAAYLNEVLDWLEANAESHLIDRWFFFTTWKNIVEPPALDPYMGIIFFDGPSEGASLNCLGQVYRARVLGLSPISCDSEGNVVP